MIALFFSFVGWERVRCLRVELFWTFFNNVYIHLIIIYNITAEAFGFSDMVKAFLDPDITKKDLMHGVSFASAASGYDELTANISVTNFH